MNYFVEGLQGSGKSTLVRKLSEKHPEYRVFYGGDYSPVELAWCAYVSLEKYREILEKYADNRKEIEAKSHEEEDHMVICYTQIITDIPGFHKDLEQYEIYNNRMDYEKFRKTVLGRFEKWKGENSIFECSIFQNITEDMILFRNLADGEIMDFYREIREALAGKEYRILYLHSDDVEANIDIIRRERSDDQGNELWFPLMLGYFNESPYAQKLGVSGEKALLSHLRHRQELELEICREIFSDKVKILSSKKWNSDKL